MWRLLNAESATHAAEDLLHSRAVCMTRAQQHIVRIYVIAICLATCSGVTQSCAFQFDVGRTWLEEPATHEAARHARDCRDGNIYRSVLRDRQRRSAIPHGVGKAATTLVGVRWANLCLVCCWLLWARCQPWGPCGRVRHWMRIERQVHGLLTLQETTPWKRAGQNVHALITARR